MYRLRTRPKYSDEELAKLYAHPHRHDRWPDHVTRVAKTIEVGKRSTTRPWDDIADLSCGDGAIAGALQVHHFQNWGWSPHLVLGDFAPGYEYQGPIEETIEQIPAVNLFVCSETIEHLHDPDAVLGQIREKSDHLLLSTPNCSWPDPNPEHYHAWDNEAVEQMLRLAGWSPEVYEESYHIQDNGQPLGYRYQIWLCS